MSKTRNFRFGGNWLGMTRRGIPRDPHRARDRQPFLYQGSRANHCLEALRFLKNTWAVRFRREDQFFCRRFAAEYQLGMVAAEVMNEGSARTSNADRAKSFSCPVHAGWARRRNRNGNLDCVAVEVELARKLLILDGIGLFAQSHNAPGGWGVSDFSGSMTLKGSSKTFDLDLRLVCISHETFRWPGLNQNGKRLKMRAQEPTPSQVCLSLFIVRGTGIMFCKHPEVLRDRAKRS